MPSFNWLRNITSPGKRISRRRVKNHTSTTACFALELEKRVLLSATAGFNSDTGRLLVTATDAETLAVGSDNAGNVTFNGSSLISGNSPVTAASVKSIVVNGGSGNNFIRLSGVTAAAFPALTSVQINGNNGNDTIAGSELADVIRGGL